VTDPAEQLNSAGKTGDNRPDLSSIGKSVLWELEPQSTGTQFPELSTAIWQFSSSLFNLV
jgi:hypothetical protein